ncbi:hypothetical protein STA3757_42730 [Stanieria sp. NIES-3757]|nr:hypothetical protein STA3757_42730 [Stanieria sp. NIES-3757]
MTIDELLCLIYAKEPNYLTNDAQNLLPIKTKITETIEHTNNLLQIETKTGNN